MFLGKFPPRFFTVKLVGFIGFLGSSYLVLFIGLNFLTARASGFLDRSQSREKVLWVSQLLGKWSASWICSLCFLFILFTWVCTFKFVVCSFCFEFGFNFRLVRSASSSNGLMMRFMSVGRCLSQRWGKEFSNSKPRFQYARRERSG